MSECIQFYPIFVPALASFIEISIYCKVNTYGRTPKCAATATLALGLSKIGN